MKEAGQVVVFRFPQTDLEEGKLRPALLLGKLPGNYDDWLIYMISSQTRQAIEGFDEIVEENDKDFWGKWTEGCKCVSRWSSSRCIGGDSYWCHRSSF